MTEISARRRKKSATVHSGGKDKYPIDSVHTAHSALKLINNAKPKLTPDQKTNVRRRAAAFGVTAKPGSAADPKSDKKKAS